MLRLLALILVLANSLYFAWSSGYLAAAGFAPVQQSERQRLPQQIHPEALQVLTPQDSKRIAALAQAEQTPTECLQAGPFDNAQADLLRKALESHLAAGAWQLEQVVVPERWIVYMGKFASADGLAKKREELAAMRLFPQALKNPDLEIGLSLGGFDTQAGALAELARLNLRGIRTARVVQESQPSQQTRLKLPALTPEMKLHLSELKPALAGKPLHNCNTAGA